VALLLCAWVLVWGGMRLVRGLPPRVVRGTACRARWLGARGPSPAAAA